MGVVWGEGFLAFFFMTWAQFQSFWNRRGFKVGREAGGLAVVYEHGRWYSLIEYTKEEFQCLTIGKMEEFYIHWSLQKFLDF
jgi:hypothetical protein